MGRNNFIVGVPFGRVYYRDQLSLKAPRESRTFPWFTEKRSHEMTFVLHTRQLSLLVLLVGRTFRGYVNYITEKGSSHFIP